MTQGNMRNDRRSPQGSGQRSTHQHNERPNPPEIRFWIDKENNLINPELFSEIAEKWSSYVSRSERNKRTQIRKFYDEVLFFYDNLKNKPKENFKQFLPFIKMIRAKVYYSLGRKHIDNDFKELMWVILDSLDENLENFENTKEFMEALVAYSKE